MTCASHRVCSACISPVECVQGGTSVTLANLFAPLPVRRLSFQRSVKREYTKALALLQAYAVISPARFQVVSENGKARSTVFTTSGGGESTAMKGPLIALFGSKTWQTLQAVQWQLHEPVLPTHHAHEQTSQGAADVIPKLPPEMCPCEVTGYLSTPMPGHGRSSADRQYLYVNGRPVEMPRINKLINETFRSEAWHTIRHSSPSRVCSPPYVVSCYSTFSSFSSYPTFFLHFRLPPSAYDINLAEQ